MVNIALAMGLPDTALGAANTAISLAPHDPGNYTLRATAYARQNRIDDALRDVDQALALAKLPTQKKGALITRAQVYRAAGRGSEALADWSAADQISPSLSTRAGPVGVLLISGDLDGAEQARRRLLEVAPAVEDEDPSFHYGWAAAYARAGYLERAQVRLDRVLVVAASSTTLVASPDGQRQVRGNALLLRAYVELARGDPGAARAAIDGAISVTGPRPALYGWRALVRRAQGDEEGAAQDVAIFMRQSTAGWDEWRGRAWAALGEPARSLTDYDAALASAPLATYLWAERAGVHLQLGDLEQALADAERAVQVGPKAALAYLARGRALAAAGRTAEARQDLTQAIALGAGGQLAPLAVAELSRSATP
jgi:tetratricopeptide (TPR) repeat protein